MGERIQTIRLTLADGRQAYFSGPAFVDEVEGVTVVSVEFSTPQPLPPDCYFEEGVTQDCEVGG